ncbi:MAG: S-layer homology domain-containing protein [Lachnospirales bacterium]
MKFKKIMVSVLATGLIIAANSVTYANTYNDVPPTHWAYYAVDSVSDNSIMLGDVSGNFNVESYLDKFETSQILARLAGYNEVNPTSSEKVYYEAAYKNNKSLLDGYDNKYSKWDTSVNNAIAFLLEKNIYEASDLSTFITVRDNKTEALRALTREEISTFLTRAMGKESEALQASYGVLFTDDSEINSTFKPYVYYLRSQRIINGDGENYFHPRNAVTRGAMAVMVNSTYNVIKSSETTTSNNNNNNNNNIGEINLVSGKVVEIYSSLNTIKINNGSEDKLYAIDSNAKITLNGKSATINDLSPNMSIAAISTDNKTLTDIEIKVNNDSNTNNNNDSNNNNTDPNTTIEGEVTNIYQRDGLKSIDIYVKESNSNGTTTSTTTKYDLAENCDIYRDGKTINFLNIKDDELITAKIENNLITRIDLDSRYEKVEGIVLEKGYDNDTKSQYYVIEEDKTEEKYKVFLDKNSKIYRSGKADWNEVRIGDDVVVELDFDTVDELTAYGRSFDFEGYIKEIFINSNTAYLKVESRKDSDKIEKFVLSPKTPKLYSLQVGTLVEIELESSEVENIQVLESAKAETISGEISDIYSSRFTLVDDDSYSVVTVYFDSDTKFFNSITGETMLIRDVDEGSDAYVTYRDADSEYAATVAVKQ